MMHGFSRRGQPLIVLVLVLGGWVSARARMWDPAAVPAVELPVRSPGVALAIPAKEELRPAPAKPDAASPAGMSVPGDAGTDEAGMQADLSDHAIAATSSFAGQSEPGSRTSSAPAPAPAPFIEPPRLSRQLVAQPPRPIVMPVPPVVAAGHQLLWMAALSQIPMPATLLAMPDPAPAPVPFYPAGSQPRGTGNTGANRWSVDSWVLWRRGSNAAPSGGLLIPSYGASQAGAVLRFRLAPGSA